MARFRLAERGRTPEDLPGVMPGYDASPTRVGGTQTTLDGSQVQQTVRWRRAWKLTFVLIDEAQYAALAAWTDPTQHGHGPFDLYEGGGQVAVVNVDELPRTVVRDGTIRSAMTFTEH